MNWKSKKIRSYKESYHAPRFAFLPHRANDGRTYWLEWVPCLITHVGGTWLDDAPWERIEWLGY